MQQQFPLSERLWLDWLDDELKAASKPKAHTAIQELFELAVQDYLSVPTWTKYLGCVLLHDRVRQLYYVRHRWYQRNGKRMPAC